MVWLPLAGRYIVVMGFIVVALRIAGVCLGAGLVLVGLPLLVTPIPVGAIMVALGILILVVSSTHAADWVRRRRRRHPGFDANMRSFEDRCPPVMRHALKRTRPD